MSGVTTDRDERVDMRCRKHETRAATTTTTRASRRNGSEQARTALAARRQSAAGSGCRKDAMFYRLVIGGAALAVAATACAPPRAGELLSTQLVRVDASYQCDDTAIEGADRCVFWRTSDGKVFYGPFSMVRLSPFGTDTIIPPPIVETGAGSGTSLESENHIPPRK
jgi:hypothetical protein